MNVITKINTLSIVKTVKKMILYKTLKGGVFVPCDSQGNPDLTRVPVEQQEKLSKQSWSVYAVKTSKDKEIFDEACEKGFSIQKIVVEIQEKE